MPREVKGWFLTYPQCTVSKEDALEFFKTLNIEEAVVCEEKHEDGNPHVHAYIKLEHGIDVKKAPTYFDLNEFHGNYQAARSWRACQEYVKKDGNFITFNLDIESAQQKRAKRNREIIDKPIDELIESGIIAMNQVPNIKRAKLIYEESKHNKFEVDPTQQRGIWIYGPPGVGKSYKARTEYPDLFIKSQNKWWDGYIGQKNVLIDDFDRQGECLSHYIKIWADVYQTTGEVKGGTVNLNYNKLIITSNYSIDEIFISDTILCEAIKRRFEIIYIPLKLC